MKLNLNDYVTVELAKVGREIWRREVERRRELMASSFERIYDRFTGEEEQLTLQFWEFISVFGGPGLWQVGRPTILKSMDVEVSSMGAGEQ